MGIFFLSRSGFYLLREIRFCNKKKKVGVDRWSCLVQGPLVTGPNSQDSALLTTHLLG